MNLSHLLEKCPEHYETPIFKKIYSQTNEILIPLLLRYCKYVDYLDKKRIYSFPVKESFYLYILVRRLCPNVQCVLGVNEFNVYVYKNDKINTSGTNDIILNNLPFSPSSDVLDTLHQVRCSTSLTYLVEPIEECILRFIRQLDMHSIQTIHDIGVGDVGDISNVSNISNIPNISNTYNHREYQYVLQKFNLSGQTTKTYTRDITDIPIRVIHQSKETKRRLHMEKLLSSIGMRHYHFREPHPATDSTKNMLRNTLNKTNLNISLGQSSQFLTYLDLLRSEEYDDLFIMEDDIVTSFSPLETSLIMQYIVNHYPQDADMIYLEFCYEQCNSESFTNLFTKLARPQCLACVYFPSLTARRRVWNAIVSDEMDHEKYCSDGVIASLIEREKIRAYSHFPLFRQSMSEFGSNISGSSTNEHNSCSGLAPYNNRYEPLFEKQIFYSPFSFSIVFVILFVLILFGIFYFYSRKRV
jgi:hypothetical protein